jgi:hypothetical protein
LGFRFCQKNVRKNYRENSKRRSRAVNLLLKLWKTYKIKFKKTHLCINFVLFLVFLVSVALAQVNEQKQDTKTGYSIGKVQIKSSKCFLSAIHMTRLPTDIFILIQLMGFPLIINYIDTKTIWV